MYKPRIPITQEKQDMIIDLYNHNHSVREICDQLNLNRFVVERNLKERGVKLRPRHEAIRKYECNHSYFSTIDSNEKAQILGMLAADGCIIPDKKRGNIGMIRLSLKESDGYYIEKVKNALGYTGPLKTRARICSISKNKTVCSLTELSINSWEMYNDLIKVGLTPRKSLTLTFPTEKQVPKEFIHSYIRGYLEGDGWICNSELDARLQCKIGMCATLEFAQAVKDLLKQELDINCSIGKGALRKDVNMWALSIGGNKQVIKFCEWIYKDFSFVLNRKFDKFLEMKSQYDDNGNYLDQLVRDDEWFINHKKVVKSSLIKEGKSVTAFFISPDNYVYYTNYLTSFSKEFGVSRFALYRLKDKQHKFHKGWSWASEADIIQAKNDNRYIEKIYN